MNQLQHALDTLPASHYLHGKQLETLKLNDIIIAAAWWRDKRNNWFRYWQLKEYGRGLEMDFGAEWKNRFGFTLNANWRLDERRQTSSLMFYGGNF